MAMPGIMGERAETCVLLEKTRVPDGEGGWETRWVDGPEFSATITHASSIEARVAESEAGRGRRDARLRDDAGAARERRKVAARMTPEAAVYTFLSSFGIPAYAASSVPDQATFPYLTYDLVLGEWGQPEVNMPVNVWYRTDSEARHAPLRRRDALGQEGFPVGAGRHR